MEKNSLLKIENLSSGYGSTIIVNDFSFEVEEGQILSITGSNGMGKTTLMKSIMGLIDARVGKVFFKNEDITDVSPDYRSKLGIGYVPQGREIFSALTVEQNILLPIYSRKNLKLNIQAKLQEIYNLFPILKEKKDANGSSLSGGQQQQLAIARALIFDPDIIILDEPAEGIQPSIVKFIGSTLINLSKNLKKAFIVVEQNISLISQLNSDCLLVEKGKLSKKIKSSDLNSIEKARNLLSLHK
ncbi:ABC transporter ATP-binding protein [Candidatus Pelagibacter sp.]|nr:ABC transporter ATP-binding protein [Candidatus Pelagibacter sp.]|tara:strand:- start:19 stop:747 length:729 start_codon:yes stop_codon:yes gene_type:complete